MKNPNNMCPVNTFNPVEEFYNENALEILQDTKFKRKVINMNKEFN